MAILLSIAIFLFFFILGNAILIFYREKYDRLTIFFLSPAIGLGAFVSIIFVLNKYNLSIAEIINPLFFFTLFATVIVLYFKRYSVGLKQVRLYILLALISLFFIGYPLFIYEFNWISIANDDMANYVLGAQRFLDAGYFSLPDSALLKEGRNYSQAFWTMHALLGVRSGAELVLSALWGITGINAIKLFMPATLAFQIIQIFAVMSILSNVTSNRKILNLAFLLLAFSPLIALGSILQLPGQIAGLALLSAAVTIFLQIDNQTLSLKSRAFYLGNLPKIIISFGLFIWYPEAIPIFGLAIALFIVINKFIYKKYIKNYLIELLVVMLIVMLISGSSLFIGTQYILFQIFHGATLQSDDPTWSALLFPYYLLPSGIAVLWGLLPLSKITPEPLNSILILIGAILLIWVIYFVIRKSKSQYLNLTSILIAQFIVTIILIKGGNGFGIFKIAMFISPFLLSALAISLINLNLKRLNKILYFCIALFIFGNITVNLDYISMGGTQNNRIIKSNTINLSEIKISDSFEDFLKENSKLINKETILISDTSNIFLAKIQAFYSKGIRIYFPSSDFFLDRYAALGLSDVDIKILDDSQQYKNYEIKGNKFKLLNSSILNSKESYLIHDTNRLEIFNHYYNNKNSNTIFVLDKAPKNRLIFINSSEGLEYHSLFRKKSAFYQLENDIYFPNSNFAAFNKNILTEAINPSQNSRLLVELTNTPTQQFNSQLPSPEINNQKLNLIGSGSARVYSEPVNFTELDGHKLLLIDMKREGKPFAQEKSLLMKAFGEGVILDSRYITTFIRDLSLVSNDIYLSLERPISISKFPSDLTNKNLEYSGIYENGDLSSHSFVILNSLKDTKFLKIKCQFPASNFSLNSNLNVIVYIDDNLILQNKLSSSNIDLSLPVNLNAGSHKIIIKFETIKTNGYQELTKPHLAFIGFENR